ncbi:hypothetical protein GW17_00057270 [Ensete ventricosum]|nr:hypothetical protein GW17_00057270 [Ensete ventricosum]
MVWSVVSSSAVLDVDGFAINPLVFLFFVRPREELEKGRRRRRRRRGMDWSPPDVSQDGEEGGRLVVEAIQLLELELVVVSIAVCLNSTHRGHLRLVVLVSVVTLP